MTAYEEREYHHGQGMPDGERIAILEANERNMARDLKEIKNSLAQVVKTLNEISGGRKAVMGLWALLGSAIGVFAALFGPHLVGIGK